MLSGLVRAERTIFFKIKDMNLTSRVFVMMLLGSHLGSTLLLPYLPP